MSTSKFLIYTRINANWIGNEPGNKKSLRKKFFYGQTRTKYHRVKKLKHLVNWAFLPRSPFCKISIGCFPFSAPGQIGIKIVRFDPDLLDTGTIRGTLLGMFFRPSLFLGHSTQLSVLWSVFLSFWVEYSLFFNGLQ